MPFQFQLLGNLRCLRTAIPPCQSEANTEPVYIRRIHCILRMPIIFDYRINCVPNSLKTRDEDLFDRKLSMLRLNLLDSYHTLGRSRHSCVHMANGAMSKYASEYRVCLRHWWTNNYHCSITHSAHPQNSIRSKRFERAQPKNIWIFNRERITITSLFMVRSASHTLSLSLYAISRLIYWRMHCVCVCRWVRI